MSAGGGPYDPRSADLPHAAMFAGWALADEVQRRIAADGLGDLRVADGVVFQHLVAGPRAIGDLAARMGVSQQAASKAVADLERRGYLRRESDAADGRTRRAALTARGEAAGDAGRRPRGARGGGGRGGRGPPPPRREGGGAGRAPRAAAGRGRTAHARRRRRGTRR